MPKSRIDFWQKKFQSNIDRDLTVRDILTSQNIRVIVIWECTVKRDREIIDKIYEEITEGKCKYIEY